MLPLLPFLALGHQVLKPAPLPREFRAAWIATVANIDWPSKKNLTPVQQRAEMTKILDLAKAMNLNAVVLQVRPAGDAFYPSSIEPWSEYLTGEQGRGPRPAYDPLQFAIDEAHKRGIELHCWFNPYRAVLSPAQSGPLAANHIARQNPSVVKRYGKSLWMDPGEPAVRKRSLEVMLDVVNRYDIDGVHIDDYFYPYKEKDASGHVMDFPDDASYGRYRARGGRLARDDWRRQNVDEFVRDLYTEIKGAKPWVKFGISPFGIYRPGYPASIRAGVDQYAELYADARKWLKEGWCDYFTPQLYWPIARTAQSYPVLLDWWLSQNVKGRHIWPGNYTSQIGNWKATEIVDQVSVTRKLHAGGNVHFSMQAFIKDSGGIVEALRNGPYASPALVPASPWLDDVAPKPPLVKAEPAGHGDAKLSWKPDGDTDVRFYEVVLRIRGKWQAPSYIGSDDNLTIRSTVIGDVRAAVIAIDRAGNTSEPTMVSLSDLER